MSDPVPVSKRRLALAVASLLGWLVQGVLLDEIMAGTVLMGLFDILVAFEGNNPASRFTAGVVGLSGVVVTLGGARARWPVWLMWLVAPSFGVLEIAALLMAIHS